VLSAMSKERSVRVRMLQGYEEVDATFEVGPVEDFTREIPDRPGKPVDADRLKAGMEVRVWNEDDFFDAEIVKLNPKAGTLVFTWSGEDEHVEAPLAYVRSVDGSGDRVVVEEGSLPDKAHSVCFIATLKDLDLASFDARLRRLYVEGVAKALKVSPGQVQVRDLAAGSVIVDTRIFGLIDDAAAVQLRTDLIAAADNDVLLDRRYFGRCKVVRGEVKTLGPRAAQLSAEEKQKQAAEDAKKPAAATAAAAAAGATAAAPSTPARKYTGADENASPNSAASAAAAATKLGFPGASPAAQQAPATPAAGNPGDPSLGIPTFTPYGSPAGGFPDTRPNEVTIASVPTETPPRTPNIGTPTHFM